MPSAMSPVNWIDRAVSITCNGEVPTLPATRLQIPRVVKRFRVDSLSPGDTMREVQIEFHAPVPINRIGWIRTRRNSLAEDIDGPVFAANDQVRHLLSTTSAHDGDIYDSANDAGADGNGWQSSGIVNGIGYHDHIVPPDGNNATRMAQFAAFRFNALSRSVFPDNFVDWGRAIYADLWPFQIGFAAPFTYGFKDKSTATRSLDGSSEYVNNRSHGWRQLSMNFRGVKALERPDLIKFLEKTRTGGRFYLVADAAVADPLGAIIARNLTPAIDQTSRAFSRFELSLIESL
jgi:hypothetical protein